MLYEELSAASSLNWCFLSAFFLAEWFKQKFDTRKRKPLRETIWNLTPLKASSSPTTLSCLSQCNHLQLILNFCLYPRNSNIFPFEIITWRLFWWATKTKTEQTNSTQKAFSTVHICHEVKAFSLFHLYDFCFEEN